MACGLRFPSLSSNSFLRFILDAPISAWKHSAAQPIHRAGYLRYSRRHASSSALSRFDVKGCFVATYTPMHHNGDINPDAVPRYAHHLLHNGAAGVFVNGTAGEGLMMTVAERKKMAEAWISCCKERIKIIVHCGALSLREAQELADHAQQKGADAISAVPSFYFSPRTPVDLVRNLKPIAAAAPKTPFLYYHIPRLTHVDSGSFYLCELATRQTNSTSALSPSGARFRSAYWEHAPCANSTWSFSSPVVHSSSQ
ncbi:hypothetical protein RvY_16942-2 [Ramazzottius varieornatus]|uniref:N-acetylneuraminate lyase n=1 Tax=Ramazzottius varieornatus TaxID=947166 RepID=A0A1D1W0B1_RAMVA|nr:hypothetical protein RvY_16942-2 [Ramazzottius varieornatus]